MKNKNPKPTNTNQCAAPTTLHCSIRVWPRVSLNIVAHRARGESLRPTAGWPSLTTPTIWAAALANSATATAVMTNDTTIARICMRSCSLRARRCGWAERTPTGPGLVTGAGTGAGYRRGRRVRSGRPDASGGKVSSARRATTCCRVMVRSARPRPRKLISQCNKVVSRCLKPIR